MSELKPCPFCGEMPVMDALISSACVGCNNPQCLISPATLFLSDKDKAAEAWNHRSTEPQWQAQPDSEGWWFQRKDSTELPDMVPYYIRIIKGVSYTALYGRSDAISGEWQKVIPPVEATHGEL